MKTSVFIAPLPARPRTPCRRRARQEPSGRRTQPACVAKPPRHTPKSKPNNPRVSNSSNRRPSNPGASSTENLTAAQLSETLSRAVGFDLILEDISRLSSFFRSFVKPKSAEPSRRENASNDADSDRQPETSLAIRAQSHAYKPKSATATKIATTYTATRGAVDRALQTLSIRTKSYVNAITQVAGDTVYKILSVGHDAFPGLRLDRAKDVVAGALKEGWTPLSVFHWQLSAAPNETLEERRREHIQYAARLLRGGALGSFLDVTGSALIGIGKTAEKLAPIVFKGVTTATSGYVQRVSSPKLPETFLRSKTVTRKRRRQTVRHNAVKSFALQERSSMIGLNTETEVTRKSSASVQGSRAEGFPPTSSRDAELATLSPSSITDEGETKPQHRVESGISTLTTDASVSGGASEQKDGTKLVRYGAMVLAAGAVATVAAGVSVPTAVTCSALMVTSMALSGAKTAIASELQVRARHRVRYSRSVQNLEGAVTQARLSSHVEPNMTTMPLIPAAQTMRKGMDAVVRASNHSATSTEPTETTSPRTFEASAYAVSESQPTIMSVPFVGVLLNWLDVSAYRVETLICTVLRRSGLYIAKNEKEGWDLLKSFQHSSNPD